MTREELIAAASGLQKSQFRVRLTKFNEDQQVCTGEVYAPYVVDSHGDMMEPEDVQSMAYDFLSKMMNDRIDLMHNNQPQKAVVVESYISSGNPEFTEGAWVVSLKIHDLKLWDDIKAGKYNGYSIELYTRKEDALVLIDIIPEVFGITEENLGHNHVFYLTVNDDGRVTGGTTSEDDGHTHTIKCGTATEEADDHSHRFFLP